MQEGGRGEQGARGPGRPLAVVLAVCLAGDLLGRGLLPEGTAALLLGLGAATALWRPGRRRALEALARLRLGPGLLLVLGLLATGRAALPPEAAEASPRGRWRTLAEGEQLRGRLEGRPETYDLPAGLVRDGEWLELRPRASGSRGAAGDGRARAVELPAAALVRHGPGAARPLDRWRGFWRHARRAGLERLGSLDDPSARSLARALCFGERRELDPELTDLFTRTGTRHALAVSGLHVALVAAIWVWPLGARGGGAARGVLGGGGRGRAAARRWLGRREAWRVALLVGFVPLAGAGAPVVRAALALACVQWAALAPGRGELGWPRRVDGLSLWCFAALVEWWFRPAAVGSLSMQLSYAATLGLLLLTGPLNRALRARLPNGGRLAEVGRLGHARAPLPRLFLQRLIDGVLGGLAASVAANVATLPLVWTVFGEWSLAGPLATLLLLPPLALFLGLAWLWVALPLELVGETLAVLAELMRWLLTAFDRWPATPMPLPTRPPALLALATLACLAAGATRLLDDRRRRLLLAAALLGLGLALAPWPQARGRLELAVLDVGHGTCALVRSPAGEVWIFDAGTRDGPRAVRDALLPRLRAWDPGRPGIALSHEHEDHSGALPWIVERHPPRAWLGALPARVAERLPHDALHLDLERGRSARLTSDAEDLELVLLRGLAEEGNEGSRNLELSSRGARLLLCGDAEGPGLARLLRADVLRGPYDVVLFPHHGSETPWLGPFLEVTRPGEVWFSAAERPPVADELDRRGIPWRCTALEGDLERAW